MERTRHRLRCRHGMHWAVIPDSSVDVEVMEMRNIIMLIATIGFVFMLLGLFAPVLGVIGTYLLVVPFAIALMEIGRATLPGKGEGKCLPFII